ncbi:MAG TPA: small-conductance mechanosensitive channel [Bacillota bacterium]|nr:small-conductance mechanosensitive channel [Bacillota bacterium]
MAKIDAGTQTNSHASQGGFSDFHNKVHFWGRITMFGVVIMTLLLPTYLSYVLGLHPGWSVILNGFIAYGAVVIPLWIVEPISYYPVLGVSGTYLAFLNGNIGNMCIPSAAMAQEVVGSEPGTKKGEVTATLAITGAALVNTTVLIVVILGGSAILGILPQDIVDSLAFVLPAIYGGVIAQIAIEKPSWGVIGIIFGVTMNLAPVPEALETFLAIVCTVGAIMLLNNMKSKKNNE